MRKTLSEAGKTIFPGYRAGKVIGTITAPLGLDAIATLITAPVVALARGAVGILVLARLALAPERPTGDVGPALDAAERFRIVAARQGVKAADLPRMLDAAWRRWAFLFLLASCLLAWALIISRTAAWYTTTACGAWALAAGTMCMRAALDHWQLRTRALGGLGAFLRDPGEWVPPSDAGQARALRTWLVLIASGALLSPGVALAAGNEVATDTAAALIGALFGEGNIPAGTPFTHALGVMTTTLTFLGAAMLGFLTISGMVATAHEGKVLGQRYNLFWAPIRICVGFGLLVPLPSGLNGADLAVFGIAGFGSNLATKMWSGFVNEIQDGVGNLDSSVALGAIGMPSPVGGMDLARQVLAAETCAAYRTRYVESGNDKYPAFYRTRTDAPLPDLAGAVRGDAHVWNYGRCGTVSVPLAAGDATASTYSAARIAALRSVVEGIRASSIPARVAADNWPTDSISGAIQPIALAYEREMVRAAGLYLAAKNREVRQRLKDEAAKTWMNAGAYWRNLAQTSQAAVQLASVPPTVTKPDLRPVWGWNAQTQSDSIYQLQKTLARVEDTWKKETAVELLSGADLGQPGDASSDLLNRILAPVTKSVTQYVVTLAQPSAADPMATFTSLGHGLMLSSQAGVAGGLAVAWATNTAPSKLLGGDGAWSWVAPIARDLLLFMNVIGIFLANILPMVPFISVYWLAVGWVMFLTEAIVVAPILAFLFIRLSGDEFIEHVHKPAMNLLFNFAFMPAFGVLGLAACYHVLPLVIGILTLWFSAAYTGQQGGHFLGLESMLVGIGLAAYLAVQATLRVCSLIHTMPTQIPRWIGYSMDGAAGRDVEKSSGAAHAAIGAAAGSLGRGLGSKPDGKNGGGGMPSDQIAGTGNAAAVEQRAAMPPQGRE